MPVGVKLAVGFCAVIGLAALILAVALARLSTLAEVVEDIAAKGLPRLELMHAIVDEADKLTRDSHGVMLARDAGGRTQQMVRFNRTRTRLGDLLGRLDELAEAFTEDERAMKSRLHAATSDYLVAVIAVARTTEGGTLRSEREQLTDSLELKLATLIEVMREYTAQELAQMNARNARAQTLRSSAIRELAILAVVVALIAALFAWWLTRSISRNLRHAVGIANAIAGGKFDNEIVPGERDEAGEMLAALKVMQANLADSFRDLELRNRESAVVTEISSLLQTAGNLGEAAEILSRTGGSALAPHAGAIYLTAASLNRLDCIARWGEADFPPVIPWNDCLALRRGRSYGATTAEREVYCTHVSAGLRGQPYLCVPMTAQGTSLGMFHVAFDPSAFPAGRQIAEHLRAQRFADQIALALANIKLRESLRDLSIRDSLTGLFNRRYLEESLEREIAGAKRSGAQLAVFMLDADHFKRFNDQYGHEAGDAVLRALGRTLKGAVRASDLACRFGGEEFTVVLIGADAENAGRWAGRLAADLARLEIKHGNQALPRLTLSMGLAQYPTHGEDPDTLLQAADLALYEAKRAGRDRLVVAGGAAKAGA